MYSVSDIGHNTPSPGEPVTVWANVRVEQKVNIMNIAICFTQSFLETDNTNTVFTMVDRKCDFGHFHFMVRNKKCVPNICLERELTFYGNKFSYILILLFFILKKPPFNYPYHCNKLSRLAFLRPLLLFLWITSLLLFRHRTAWNILKLHDYLMFIILRYV